MRVEYGTRFYDSTDERCHFNMLVLERGRYNPSTEKVDDDLTIGFVQIYDGATGGFSRYCGRYDEKSPAASIKNIMESGSKFDDILNEWKWATERMEDYQNRD